MARSPRGVAVDRLQPLSVSLNSEEIVASQLTVIAAGIGLVLYVPITTAVAVRMSVSLVRAILAAALAQPVEIEPRMVDVETMPIAHGAQHRTKDRFVHVLHPLA